MSVRLKMTICKTTVIVKAVRGSFFAPAREVNKSVAVIGGFKASSLVCKQFSPVQSRGTPQSKL